jgi:hypothetical protein
MWKKFCIHMTISLNLILSLSSGLKQTLLLHAYVCWISRLLLRFGVDFQYKLMDLILAHTAGVKETRVCTSMPPIHLNILVLN